MSRICDRYLTLVSLQVSSRIRGVREGTHDIACPAPASTFTFFLQQQQRQHLRRRRETTVIKELLLAAHLRRLKKQEQALFKDMQKRHSSK